MFTPEEKPWIRYLEIDEETLERTLRADTPPEIREAYERHKEYERKIEESGKLLPK